VAGRTHYDVLGVPVEASASLIREAYRHRARDNHPDRLASSATPVDVDAMARINEAYRVLSDPGRRAMYDATLRGPSSAVPPSTRPSAARGPGSSRFDGPETPDGAGSDWSGVAGAVHPSHVGPARVPWRTLLFCGVLAVTAIVVIAQFTKPSGPAAPDGILRVGDCVTIDANDDAREVPCSIDPATEGGTVDVVVRAFIPFDATCPGRTEAHRDRQGMGIACVGPAD
jgi:molecular chaperone DnaJ